MTPDDAAEERVEEDVEEEPEACFRLEVAGSAKSKEESALSRVDLRDDVGMLAQLSMRVRYVTKERQGVADGICGAMIQFELSYRGQAGSGFRRSARMLSRGSEGCR